MSSTALTTSTLSAVVLTTRYLRKRRSKKKKHGGSLPGRSPNIARDHYAAYQRFFQQYLSQKSTYTDEQFRSRFRMSRALFLHIVSSIGNLDKYFTWRKDCTGKLGVHPAIKVAASLRMLAYGCSADSLDEFFSIGESTVLKSLDRFLLAVISLFGPHQLRLPTAEDLKTLLDFNAARGFPGMIGSIDCMKWTWKNCPSSWCGAFEGADKKPTVVLEAVASADLHIWHAFIGMPGSNNDLNILDASPLLAEYLADDTPQFSYEINGRNYDFLYYLADGIYPSWKCFVKTISAPVNEKQSKFAKAQEAVRKDVERAFGVLQARFAVVARPARTWSLEKIKRTLKCCVILHNMIIENDVVTGRKPPLSVYGYTASTHGYRRHQFHGGTLQYNEVPECFIKKYRQVMDSALHFQLKADLIEHVSTFF